MKFLVAIFFHFLKCLKKKKITQNDRMDEIYIMCFTLITIKKTKIFTLKIFIL